MAKRPVFFFCGIDPAPSDSQRSDWGSLVTAAATPRTWPTTATEADPVLSPNPADWWFDYCHARVITFKEKASARQWSGMIHELHARFGYEKVLMDAGSGGGGILIARELRAPRQLILGAEKEVIPICDQVDGPKLVARGHFILHLFKRGDPGIELVWPSKDGTKSLAGDELLKDGLYSSMKEGLDGVQVGFPAAVEDWYADRREELEAWPQERQWALKNLSAGRVQLKDIMVATHGDGTQMFTKRGARIFSSLGRDDIALGLMLARGAFLIWLTSPEFYQGDPEDEVGFSGW